MLHWQVESAVIIYLYTFLYTRILSTVIILILYINYRCIYIAHSDANEIELNHVQGVPKKYGPCLKTEAGIIEWPPLGAIDTALNETSFLEGRKRFCAR